MGSDEKISDVIKEVQSDLFQYLNDDIATLSEHIPNLGIILSPKISILQNHLQLGHDVKHKGTRNMFEHGILTAHFCINARTNEPHTECDSSYTVISIPPQINQSYKTFDPKFNFIINKDQTVVIKLIPNLCFIYSGYMLVHHQVLQSVDTKIGIFINIASYGNKRLFDNMMQSFKRSIDFSNEPY